jgi:hypothetical protein
MSKNKTRNNKKKDKKKYKKRLAGGSRKSFLDKKVLIDQLKQFNIPKELRTNTLKHFSASVIQDRFNEKYLGRIRQELNRFTLTQLINLKQSMDFFITSVYTSYEFNTKNIPGIILEIEPEIKRGSQAAKFLIDLKENNNKLKELFKRVGYNNIIITINTMINRIEVAIVCIRNFRNFAIEDYRAAQLGIENEPNIRNTTTRRANMISRPPRTMRATAMTRKTRSNSN